MNTVVLLAGGEGNRVGGNIAKQHIIVNEHQIIEYTLMAFSNCKEIDQIVVVSNLNYIKQVEDLRESYNKLICAIPGGKTRIESVFKGIQYIETISNDNDKIIISDAARPCITTRELNEMIKAFDNYIAVTTCVSSNETILKVEGEEITQIIQRDGIKRQTSPEGYKFFALKWLYLASEKTIVDTYRNIGIDQLYACGTKIGIVDSNPLNFKITTADDIKLFQTVLRTGFQEIINS